MVIITMADKSIKLLFEVLGGGDIDGESGKKIQEQIAGIASKISENGTTELKFKANKQSLNALR